MWASVAEEFSAVCIADASLVVKESFCVAKGLIVAKISLRQRGSAVFCLGASSSLWELCIVFIELLESDRNLKVFGSSVPSMPKT